MRIAWKDRAERDAERRDLEARDARRVRVERHGILNSTSFEFIVHNGGESPIESVPLVDLQAMTHQGVHALSWRAGSRAPLEACPMDPGTVMPGNHTIARGLTLMWPVEDVDLYQVETTATVEFVDVAGRLWRRVGTAQPEQILPLGKRKSR